MNESMGWWTISGDGLLEMLRKVAAGADPDLVYAEHYANSDHEHFGSCGGSGWVPFPLPDADDVEKSASPCPGCPDCAPL